MATLAKVAFIGLISLLLLIPLLFIQGVISERESYRERAFETIAQGWGEDQTLGPPVLMVPVTQRVETDDKVHLQTVEHLVLPAVADIEVETTVERRYLGLFEMPVYTATVNMTGAFDPSVLDAVAGEPNWARSRLLLPLIDPRGLRRIEAIALGEVGVSITGNRHAGRFGNALATERFDGRRLKDYSITLEVAGSGRLMMLPLGERTRIEFAADWPSPSFIGAFLPATRSIDDAGFDAQWQVLSLNRSYGQVVAIGSAMTSNTTYAYGSNPFPNDALGVSFVVPVDVYRLSERAVKYGLLFIAATFLIYFLFETLAGARLHPVQYGLVGLALAVFYLLVVAGAEHIGFGWAYSFGALALCALVGGYSAAILRSRWRGGVIAGLLAIMYTILFLILSSESHALLAGTVFVFTLLSAAMWLTRNVDWFAASPARRPKAKATVAS